MASPSAKPKTRSLWGMFRDPSAVIQGFRETPPAPIYFLAGDDHYLQHRFIENLKEALGTHQSVEVTHWHPDVSSIPEMLVELRTRSLFGGGKLFILRQPSAVRGNARKELLDYCRAPNPEYCLAVVSDDSVPAPSESLYKLYEDLAAVTVAINTAPPFPSKMEGWARFLLDQENLVAEEGAAEALVEMAGDSVYHMANEVSKLAVNCAGRPATADDVTRLSGWRRSYSPRQFIDAVAGQRIAEAIHIAQILLSSGTEPTSLVGQLASLFQDLWLMGMNKVAEGSNRAYFGGGGARRKQVADHAHRRSLEQVESAIDHLAEADRLLKTTPLDGDAVLIPLIYRIASPDA